MKKLVFATAMCIYLIIGYSTCLAQKTFKYVYDNAGNRISRNIITLKSTIIDSTKNETTQNNIDTSRKNRKTDVLGNVKLNLYPNPTSGKIMIELSNYSNENEAVILLFNIKGQLLFKKVLASSNTTINLSDRPQGIYIAKIILNEVVSEWKIIKE